MNGAQKIILLTGVLAFVLIIGFFIAMTRVEPGWVGVLVKLGGKDRGVQQDLVQPGRTFVGINEDLYPYPIFVRTYKWTASEIEESPVDEAIRFQCEGLQIAGDFSIAIRIPEPNVIPVFLKWRKTIDQIIDDVVYPAARDELNRAASNRTVDQVYSSQKVELLNEVKLALQSRFEPLGILVEEFNSISDFYLPKQVKASIDSKIKASQEALQAVSTAQKKIEEARGDSLSAVIKAAGEAAAMKMKNQQVTDQLVQWELATKWNGTQPLVVSNGGQILDLGAIMKK